MLRTRAPKPSTVVLDSAADFLAAKRDSGLYAVKVGSQRIDLRYDDRGAPATMIAFHAALSNKVETLPAFQGVALARDAGMNYIGLADPALALGDIDLGWFLGDQVTGPLRPILVPMIRHLLGDRRAVLFGASGGGYAALTYAQDFPDCTVIAANPRLNMTAPTPVARIDEYAEICHGASTAAEIARVRSEYVVEDVADLYPDGLPFDLVLLQNQNDWHFLNRQAKPFLEKMGDDPRIEYVKLKNGEGHVPVPRETLVKTLTERAVRPRAFAHMKRADVLAWAAQLRSSADHLETCQDAEEYRSIVDTVETVSTQLRKTVPSR